MKTDILETGKKVSEHYVDSDVGGVSKASDIGRTFLDVNSNVSIKSEYTRDDYDYYRNYESGPKSAEKNISLSLKAYSKVGIVRNIVDLMADFTVKGIRLVHENPAQEKFFNEWWQYINGDSISERFCNYLYRIANVVVNTTYGKIPVRTEKRWSSSKGNDEVIREVETEYRRIPLRYNFINPLSIEVISPEISMFTGKSFYALRLNSSLRTGIARLESKYPEMKKDEILSIIPKHFMDAIKSGKNIVPIDSNNISIYYYKKDDWDVWARPMISSILDDLITLEKMKLADNSALDGAISSVRLWKLGRIEGDNPNLWILPTQAMFRKLRNILANGLGGGTLDLVWGPDIDFKESETKVHVFLGPEKYEAVYHNIYGGLGIPFGQSNGSGLNNNFIAMQTFVERLEYGRTILIDFWSKEIKRVQKAMGYSKPAEVVFENINLGDDSTYKKLLIELLDRDIIGIDTVLNSFKFSSVEKKRVQRDYRARKSGKVPNKAGPYHSPNIEQDLRKIALQRGMVTPSEIGMTLEERKDGEITPNEQQVKLVEQQKLLQQKYSPPKQNGRPEGKKDSSKRKMKSLPISKSSVDFVNNYMFAHSAHKIISDIVTPVLLEKAFNKKNVRSLTLEEFDELEAFKFVLLSNLSPGETPTEESIGILSQSGPKLNLDLAAMAKILKNQFMKTTNREPSAEEMRQIQCSAFALFHEKEPQPEEIDTELEFFVPVL